MKLIMLRGLPGCGKSTIAEKLENDFNVKVVYGDVFKREFIENNIDYKNKDAYEYSYVKIFETINTLFNSGEKIIICEELFNSEKLINKIVKYCAKNEIELVSFIIERNIDLLLKNEHLKDRKIKNTKEDFVKIKSELNNVHIKNETVVNNKTTINDATMLIARNSLL